MLVLIYMSDAVNLSADSADSLIEIAPGVG